MKKIFLSFAVFTMLGFGVKAETPNVLYTFVFNKASGGASVPIMVGFANISQNSQNGTQMGFANRIDGDLNGAQFGFANIVSDNLRGAQFGFSNIVRQGAEGAQFGFANIVRQSTEGAQFGFANIVGDNLRGAQYGFVNTINGDNRGAQFGFVNKVKSINGFQAGFVNIADRYEKGIPLGFLNIVKHGGYQAVEYSFNNLYPLNIYAMTGLPYFYSIMGVSYHSGYSAKFALNAGVGSVIELSPYFDFVPEFVTSWGISAKEDEQVSVQTLKAKFGYNLYPNLSLMVGPVVSWQQSGMAAVLENNFLDIVRFDFNERNRLNIGFEVSLRYAINR